jgi:hypothetical protein
MLAQVGTQDGEVIERFEIGKCVDLSSVEDSINRILEVKETDIKKWRRNIARIPQSLYAYTDEHERLLNHVRK